MALTLSNVTISYGEKKIVEDLSYVFPECGCVLFVGASGSGKTTLLRAIAGLRPIDGGSMTGGGEASFAFQEHRLFPSLNAAENIAVATSGHKKNTADAVRMLCLLGFKKEETTLYPTALSGGMKQRVSLARAFLKEAPILLLDEPFKELDPTLVETVTKLIRKEAERRLVIFTSHTEVYAEMLGAQILRVGKG